MRYTLITACLVATAASLTSCDKKADFQGDWTATSPIDLSQLIPEADHASSLMSISFIDENNVNGGPVMLSTILSINQAVTPAEGAAISDPYEVSVAATASVSGKWMYKDNDRDELVLSLDPGTLNVNVDRNGVTFSQNLLTGEQQPAVDSLTAVTVQAWQAAITKALNVEMQRFSFLDDVEVAQKGTVLSFEIENPKQTLNFRRTE